MKKVLGIFVRLFFGGIVLLGLGFVVTYAVLDEDKPEPIEGANADQVAIDMLRTLNLKAWNDTRYVSWAFPGGHSYVWDKRSHVVEVKWNENRVVLQTNNPSLGVVWVDGKTTQSKELLDTAWAYFCNDSFWLVAPFKVMDPGTQRSVVRQDDEGSSLMVTYTSGGTTPGDTYVWHMDSDGMPYEYQMWVGVLPIGGIKAEWTGWQDLSSGAKVSTVKKMFNALPMDLSPVKSGNELSDLGLPEDYFTSVVPK